MILQLMAVTDLGCRDTAFREFVVNPLPQVFFIADTNELCGPGEILFTDSSTLEGGNILNRGWNFGDGSSAFSSLDTITHRYTLPNPEQGILTQTQYYTVTLNVTSDSMCVGTDSIVEMIQVHPLPYPKFELNRDSIPITAIEDIVVTNYSENAYYFEWVMNDTSLWEDVYEPHLWDQIADTGTFSLELFAQSVNGCWDSTESQFKVYPVLRFFIPNAFSPNGNGVNETFGPKGKYFDDKQYKMQVFSRWGELVFDTENFYETWDGKDQSSGKLQPIGVYAWVIEVTDLQGNITVHKGFVTLVL